MKTVKNLFDKITDWDNLLLAAHKARRGKGWKAGSSKFFFNLEKELLLLQQELQSQTYRPGQYTTFYIYDPKKRLISAAPFRDRVVHHALCNIIEPIFEKTFVRDTYANRKSKGTHAAIRLCQQYLRSYPYVLKCDIEKYFPSIDHAILKTQIRRKIGCAQTLWLIDAIIDGSNPQEPRQVWFPGDDLFTPAERRRGLPLGNLTSQYFANLYLSPFDHFVKEELGRAAYIRYVDDFVVFGSSKQEIWELKARLEMRLQGLRLMLHPRKCHVSPSANGISFLGQRVFCSHRHLRKGRLRCFLKKLEEKTKAFKARQLNAEKLEQSLNSWRGHALQANAKGLLKKVALRLFFQNILLLKRLSGGWMPVFQRTDWDNKKA